MTRVRFVANKRVRDQLGTDPRMGAALGVFATQIAQAAQEIAPYDEHQGEHYRDMIEVEVGRAGRSGRGRFRARVIARKWTSRWIEFGTVKMPAFAPLRRAASGLGSRFRPQQRNTRDVPPLS